MVDGVVYFQHSQIILGTENEIKVDRKGWLQMYLLETFVMGRNELPWLTVPEELYFFKL